MGRPLDVRTLIDGEEELRTRPTTTLSALSDFQHNTEREAAGRRFRRFTLARRLALAA
jgi:hypothetical protein